MDQSHGYSRVVSCTCASRTVEGSKPFSNPIFRLQNDASIQLDCLPWITRVVWSFLLLCICWLIVWEQPLFLRLCCLWSFINNLWMYALHSGLCVGLLYIPAKAGSHLFRVNPRAQNELCVRVSLWLSVYKEKEHAYFSFFSAAPLHPSGWFWRVGVCEFVSFGDIPCRVCIFSSKLEINGTLLELKWVPQLHSNISFQKSWTSH